MQGSSETLRCTVVIVTRNRKEDLRNAIRTSLEQSAPLHVLVIDDASTDGTAEMVRNEFPGVRLDHAVQSRGYIVQRNRGARLVATPIVFSIDDDAAFPSRSTVAQTLVEFDDPRVGAVAVPYVDVNRGDAVVQRAPGDSSVYVTSHYRGTAHALRRELFVRLGGYREILFHQGEESDYCIRMLEAGYVTRLGRGDPIHHFESPRRDRTRQSQFNARNLVLYSWHNVPMPYMTLRLGGSMVNLVRGAIEHGYLRATLRGIRMGYGEILRGRASRGPVRRGTYRLMRWLERNSPMRMAEVEARMSGASAP